MRAITSGCVTALVCGLQPLAGQALPPYSPINPIAVSRTGLATQPFTTAAPGWRVTALIDYASPIEYA